MTAHEFGMWGFSVLVWVFTLLSAVWGLALVRNAIHSMKVNQFINELFVQDILNGEYEIIEEDRNDDDADYR